jgi:hypothetical protein
MKIQIDSLSRNIKIILVVIFFFSIGVFLGIVIQNKIPIVIDEKIRYSELLNWITTVVIGIIIGYDYKNQFENNKIIKNYLLDDLKNISIQLVNVKSYCTELRSLTSLTEEQRKEVISKVNMLDKKIKVFLDLLKDCDNSKHNSINENLINSLNSFNRKLTSDGIYDNPIQTSYFDDIMAEGSKFEGEVRRITLSIIKTM